MALPTSFEIHALGMAKSNVNSLVITLQGSIGPDDCECFYSVSDLPDNSTLNPLRLIRSVSVVSNSIKPAHSFGSSKHQLIEQRPTTHWIISLESLSPTFASDIPIATLQRKKKRFGADEESTVGPGWIDGLDVKAVISGWAYHFIPRGSEAMTEKVCMDDDKHQTKRNAISSATRDL